MQPITDVNAFIIDMDGVLWEEMTPLPGLTDFFILLREKTISFILATNNASLTQQQYVDKLKLMGVSVSAKEILTSSMATAYYLSEHVEPESTRLFVIGEKGLRQPLIDKGFAITDSFDKKQPADFVICGLDRHLNWEKLTNASLHLNAGARLVATNADTSLPTEQGRVLGNGAILAALESASQQKAEVIGKPEATMYHQAIKILNVSHDRTIAIGDRLNTDILGAINTGIRSIMVLTGISSREDLKSIDYQPTWVMQGIQEITHALRID
jgi:4-nitrophenyl phosphatase